MYPAELEERFADFWTCDLGFCGCGDPHATAAFLLKILEAIDQRSKADYSDHSRAALHAVFGTSPAPEAEELILQCLEQRGLLEHGANLVSGAWLSNAGHDAMIGLRRVIP